VGGKAAQLAKLAHLGLRVPEAFVVVGAAPGRLPPELDAVTTQLAGRVAVRSSALGEDSADASFAGQFETVLGVEGPAAVRAAVERCLASTSAGRVDAYRNAMSANHAPTMAVVVQRMVEPLAAGVIFTADPLTGARDRVVVNAVSGLGEALVGGYRTPDEYVASRSGAILERTVRNGAPTLDDGHVRELVEGALKAEDGFGCPLDLEWAMGRDGLLYWLQARPIATLDLPGPDELDDPVDPGWQLTGYNVAEWMPGAMPPLSWSVVGHSYIKGMLDLQTRAGVSPVLAASIPILANVQGHAFINMSNLYLLGSQMFGMAKEDADLTLTGQVLPPAKLPPPAPAWVRLRHTLRYMRLIPAGRKRLDAFIAREAGFRIEPTDDLAEYARRLDAGRAVFEESGAVHVHACMMAIALLNLFDRLLSKGGAPSAKSHAAAAALLAGAKWKRPEASESSIGLADALDRLGAHIASAPGATARFVDASAEAALAWLRGPDAGTAREAFAGFLNHHGHRCIRELDLRERDWEEDPLPLVQALQRIASVPPQPKTDWTPEAHRALVELGWIPRQVIERLLPTAYAAIVLRERSKSFSVWIARQLKRGYVGLGRRLVALGRLPDTDLVFFFEHEELMRLARADDRALVRRAQHRRRLHPRKMATEFPMVCQGKPRPLADSPPVGGEGSVMHGIPLSRGVVVGPARVARTLEDAADMRAGEILVTAFIDVGWTPYFSRAGGVASQVGSVLSHAAVVAREYGLPALAGLPGATRWINTGDLLRLDANTGELRRLS
jgi:pyruvate,water dikinase